MKNTLSKIVRWIVIPVLLVGLLASIFYSIDIDLKDKTQSYAVYPSRRTIMLLRSMEASAATQPSETTESK